MFMIGVKLPSLLPLRQSLTTTEEEIQGQKDRSSFRWAILPPTDGLWL